MIDSFWITRLLHLAWGVALYVVFQGWGVLGETTAADAPRRGDPNANSFAFGQAVAISGVIGLSLLCARILYQTLQAHEIEYLTLWGAATLTLVEAASAGLSNSLVAERVPIEIPDFKAGRDLILRHSPPLFLGLVTVGAWLGPTTTSMIAGGSLIGWGLGQMLSGPGRLATVGLWSRWTAAILGLGMGTVLLRAAFKWTF